MKEVDHLLGLLSPEMLSLGLAPSSEMLRRHSPRQPMHLGFEPLSSLSSHVHRRDIYMTKIQNNDYIICRLSLIIL